MKPENDPQELIEQLPPISERVPNAKWRRFIDEYFKQNLNATKAYQTVYGCAYESAKVNAAKLLTNTNITEEIERRLQESAMSANEVLSRLAMQARANVEDFLEFKDGIKEPYLNLQQAKDAGLLPLIKKLKYNAQGRLEIELHDAQSALALIGKYHGTIIDKLDVTSAGEPITIQVKYADSGSHSKETTSEAE